MPYWTQTQIPKYGIAAARADYRPKTAGISGRDRAKVVPTTPTTPTTPETSTTPVTSQQQQPLSAALGYNYQPYAPPAYSPQAYNVNLPTIDWSFTPTEAQRGGWQTQATATAAQEIDPQLQAIATALQQYMTQGQNVRAELNPRYTNQSLGIANIIQNTVKQEAINNAIRRGAETSGWLPQALMEAGKLETEQRSGIEAQRNMDLSALAALEAQQTQAAGEQGTMLEGLRGQRITTALAELENQAWARAQQEKESQWTSALGGEQLRASAYGANAANILAGYQTQAQVGMSNADRQLQAAIAAAEQGNVQWQQQFATAQSDWERTQAALNAAMGGVGADEPTYTYKGTPGLSLEQYLFYMDKDRQYAQNEMTPEEKARDQYAWEMEKEMIAYEREQQRKNLQGSSYTPPFIPGSTWGTTQF